MKVNVGEHAPLEHAVKDYLSRVVEISLRWSAWLAEHEQVVLLGQISRLREHGESVRGLFGELQDLVQARQVVLADAGRAGIVAVDVNRLARALPAWRDPRFRESLSLAQRRMSHLKRLNLATWVLVSQCARMTDETIHLLIHGKPESSVYSDSSKSDDNGGQLLDAQA